MAWMFMRTALNDHVVQLFFNEYGTLETDTDNRAGAENYLQQFIRLTTAGARVGGLGLQSHMSASVCPECILRKLDILSQANVPMWFTEVRKGF